MLLIIHENTKYEKFKKNDENWQRENLIWIEFGLHITCIKPLYLLFRIH